MPTMSSQRAAAGNALERSGLSSRIGDSARARCSAQVMDTPSPTASVMDGSRESTRVSRLPAGLENRTTAPHSAGRRASWSSIQTAYTPTDGPSASTCASAGVRRSVCAPSTSTTIARAGPLLLPVSRRYSMRADNSATRDAALSASSPSSAWQFASAMGCKCGSQRVHSHVCAREGSARSTNPTSRGLCSAVS